jgi:MFS family permease
MKPSLKPLYSIQSLNSFAGSLVGIFIPIFLLSIGYSFHQVMVFILLQAVFSFLVALTAGYLSVRIPMRTIMMLSIPLLVIVLVLLSQDHAKTVPLVLIAALYGAQFAFYWIPLHLYLTQGTSSGKIGKQLGLFFALPQAASALAPLLSGLIISVYGYNLVFVLAAVIFALTAIPMASVPSVTEPLDMTFSKFRSLYTRFKTYFWLEVIENIQEELDGVIWPLGIFIALNSTISAGLAGTLIAAGSAVFTYVLGHASDSKPGFPYLRLGALVMTLLWCWRLFHLSISTVIVISALVGIATMLIAIPFNALIYNLARDNNPREFIMFREVPVFLARGLVYSLGAFIAINFHQLFWLGIVAYGAFVFLKLPKAGLQKAAG